MRILYINGHPDPESFHSAIRDAYLAGIDPTRHEVRVLNLGEQSFDPVLRFGYRQRMDADPEIEEAQRLVQWADHLVSAFPVWWGDAPALLKGWIERVFTPGFAYSFAGASIGHLLKGRSAELIVTQRGLRPLAWIFGNHQLGIFRRNLFGLTGIRLRGVLSLGGIGLIPRTDSPDRRARFLVRVRRSSCRR